MCEIAYLLFIKQKAGLIYSLKISCMQKRRLSMDFTYFFIAVYLLSAEIEDNSSQKSKKVGPHKKSRPPAACACGTEAYSL